MFVPLVVSRSRLDHRLRLMMRLFQPLSLESLPTLNSQKNKVAIGQYSTFKACNIEVLYLTETFIYRMPSI
jgi:hypothetical protein